MVRWVESKKTLGKQPGFGYVRVCAVKLHFLFLPTTSNGWRTGWRRAAKEADNEQGNGLSSARKSARVVCKQNCPLPITAAPHLIHIINLLQVNIYIVALLLLKPMRAWVVCFSWSSVLVRTFQGLAKCWPGRSYTHTRSYPSLFVSSVPSLRLSGKHAHGGTDCETADCVGRRVATLLIACVLLHEITNWKQCSGAWNQRAFVYHLSLLIFFCFLYLVLSTLILPPWQACYVNAVQASITGYPECACMGFFVQGLAR